MQISASGAITTTGVISGSNALSASYALNATTSSFAVSATSASFAANATSASYAVSATTASFANSLTVAGTLTAQTLVVQTITSSVDFVTGSTRFGSIADNTHVFTGSMSVSGSGTFTGNIGIGLINPGVALDVSGYGRVTGIGLNSTPTSIGANPNYVRLTNTGGDLYIGQEGSTNAGFFVGSLAYDSVLYSGRPYNFIINGTSRVYINSSGSVGIGNTNPTYRLDIHNGSDFDIRLRDTSLGGTVGILFETANDFSGTSQAYIKGIGAGNSGVSQLIFGTAGASGNTTATERMRITSAGNVGIGTSSTGFNTAGLPLVVGSGSGNTGLTIFSGATSAGSIHFADAETTGIESYAGYINYDHTANSMQFGTTGPTPLERMKITSGGTVFYKGYFGGNLMGGFSVIGTLSAINVADRYLHARINTVGTMMYWIKVFGYVYTTNIIEGLSGGYLGGGTGGVQQAFQNGSIVAQYQNAGYLEVVVDTTNTNTTNRWGSITFLGGTDTIATVQPLEIMAYSWTSTVTRVY
jgi:hypothetical protein